MIVISFLKIKNTKTISISGHANFDELGKDIVCAGVSAISFGFCEYLKLSKDKFINYKLFKKENKIIFTLKNDRNKFYDKIFSILYIQLKLVYINYQKNIKWIENNESN